MAKLTLVYGMRLLPSDDIAEVDEGVVKLKNGQEAHVTLHILEGSTRDDIEKQLRRSVEAFFDLYPEI
jgi:cell division protein YceG involved in septum cleavage